MILTVTLNPAIDKVYQVENFSVGEVFRPSGMWATAGGKGLNVSRVCRILGEEITATGFLGGSTGQFIRSQIKELGIKDQFVEIEGETRTCIAVNDPKRGTSTEVLESGPEITKEEQQAFLKRFESLVPEMDVITASGSLPRGLDKDFYKKLVEIAGKHKKRLILDTSGEALIKGLASRPFMVKPNEDELKAIADEALTDEKEIMESALKIHRMGIPLVCVTLGKKGCIAVWEGNVYRFRHPSLQVVNTVGSGDSFVAGCATALSRGGDYYDAVLMGMACGMANTQFHETGKVSTELVEQYHRMITYTKGS